MKTKQLLFLFIVILNVVTNTNSQIQDTAKSRQFQNEAFEVWSKSYDPQNLKKAIELLDKAISYDTTYYLAYYNKFVFQNTMHDYKGALKTAFTLIRLKPQRTEHVMAVGFIYETLGNKTSAMKYYNKALVDFKACLDTVQLDSVNRDFYKTGYALALIMVGSDAEGQKILLDLEENGNEFTKEAVQLWIGKSRNNILQYFTNPEDIEEDDD